MPVLTVRAGCSMAGGPLAVKQVPHYAKLCRIMQPALISLPLRSRTSAGCDSYAIWCVAVCTQISEMRLGWLVLRAHLAGTNIGTILVQNKCISATVPPYDGLRGAKGGKITLFINNWTSVEDISNY